MSLKEQWKNAGKGIGHAFANFGKSMATTAKVVLGKEERVDEEGNSTLKKSWTKTGKGFGEAGKGLGQAAVGTVDKIAGEEEEKKEETQEDVIDAEVVEEKPAGQE